MFNRPQWLNWFLQDKPGAPKPVKTPLAPVNDPLRWIPYETARTIDPEHIGFVLTADDPYFCIDLDHAWNGSEWSALSQAVVAMFPGAYVEVSYSGDGLHIIGQGTLPDGFGTRGAPPHHAEIECYTHLRYIAITGTHATGNPDTPCDLARFAHAYLAPAGAVDAEGWTTAPCAEHTPIADDNELVRKMLTARASAATAFGGKASPMDLWNNVVPVLADTWPSQTDEYDRSAADAALAAHLAFWTGKNCARIERLMRMSALVRPKWDDHKSYMARTITGACAQCSKVYTGGAAVTPFPDQRTGPQFLDLEGQREWFKGCTYVIGAHRVLMPNGMLLKPDQFRVARGGFEFFIDPAGGRPTKSAFEAFTESRITRFPKTDAMCFRPEIPPATIVEEGGLTMVNTYVPAVVILGDGDVLPWFDLVAKLFPNNHDRGVILAYLAALRQHPGIKFRWCPLIQGVEGNGKGVIMSTAEYAVGERYTHKPNAKELADSGAKFTGWLDRKLLILIEEIYVSDRREALDALKPLITDDRVEIQHKGADQVTSENRANFILTSNHKDAIMVTRNDRRYAVFYTGQQTKDDLARDGMAGDYMPKMWRWLRGGGFANVAGWLDRYQIPDELNPATTCHRAPATSSTDEAIRESRSVIEQEILQAIEEGRAGFAGGWVSSVALTRLLREINRTVPPRKRASVLATLGYVPHPIGQIHTPIFGEENKRPVLYVQEGSIQALNYTVERDVISAYCKAQGYGDARGGVIRVP